MVFIGACGQRRLYRRWLQRPLALSCMATAASLLLLLLLLLLQRTAHNRQFRADEVQQALESQLRNISQLTPTAQLAWKLRDFRVKELNCLRLISGSRSELHNGLHLSESLTDSGRSDYDYSMATCTEHRSRLVTSSLSEEESSFALAFSVMVYKDFDQVIRLLRAVYRPEHVYCLHVDSKADWWFRQAVATFAGCLDNVMIAKPSVDVQWGRYSVLEADLACFRLLLSQRRRWLYLLNLTGQEFPLRTMRELAGILRQLGGANNMENAGPVTSYRPHRLLGGNGTQLVWRKGSVHAILSRGFVQFPFGPVGVAIRDDLRRQDAEQQRAPPVDELLFATLNYNAGVIAVPGAPLDSVNQTTDNVLLPFLPRYKNWIKGVFGYPCLSGRVVRNICIWGLADLPGMNRRFELFANKFHADYQPLAQRCIEERFWHNTLSDYGLFGLKKTWSIDVTSYADYAFVRRHS